MHQHTFTYSFTIENTLTSKLSPRIGTPSLSSISISIAECWIACRCRVCVENVLKLYDWNRIVVRPVRPRDCSNQSVHYSMRTAKRASESVITAHRSFVWSYVKFTKPYAQANIYKQTHTHTRIWTRFNSPHNINSNIHLRRIETNTHNYENKKALAITPLALQPPLLLLLCNTRKRSFHTLLVRRSLLLPTLCSSSARKKHPNPKRRGKMLAHEKPMHSRASAYFDWLLSVGIDRTLRTENQLRARVSVSFVTIDDVYPRFDCAVARHKVEVGRIERNLRARVRNTQQCSWRQL